MIKFKINQQKVYNGDEVVVYPEDEYIFENTLKAMKKWEALYQKPWLGSEAKTSNEMMYYFKCMNVEDREIHPELLNREQINALSNYLNNPMGAHRLPKTNGGKAGRTTFTAELIYAYCIINRIDLEWAEKQNLNQLMTIIGVVNALQEPPKKMSESEIMQQNAKLNAQRRAQLQSKG